MKKLILSLLLFSATIASAQTTTDSSKSKKTLFTKKSWELSLIGSLSLQSSENANSRDPNGYFSFSISPAYYLFDKFSLEPEFTTLLRFVDVGSETNYQLMMNVGYTFRTTRTYHPYVKVGYGISNMITQYYAGAQASLFGADNVDELVQCFNAGAGIKWIVGGNIAIKAEMNYRTQNYSYIPYNWDGQSDTDIDVSMRHLGLLLGMSIFL